MSDSARPPLYDLRAARTPAQRLQMEGLEADGICVFCPEHFDAHHREPILMSGEHWYVTENDYPYPGTSSHFLIVPHAHVSAFDELPDEAAAELWAFKRRLKGDAIATATVERSGDMHFNGGSIAHLHVHFVTLPQTPDAAVRFRVSAKPKDHP